MKATFFALLSLNSVLLYNPYYNEIAALSLSNLWTLISDTLQASNKAILSY